MKPDPHLTRIVGTLATIPGIKAIALGGSRARGTAHDGSDHDIGLYFSAAEPPDIKQLQQAVRALADDPAADVTGIGDWGPWIVGGAWLRIAGRKVDLLYRQLDAVTRVIEQCCRGHIEMHYQPGHPHGFMSAIWMGEVALCRVLHDPTGALGALKARCSDYPAPLREAIIRRFHWEIQFGIENAELALTRGDQTHIAGCAYRALACLAQVLFAINGRYLINEKGALDEAAQFPLTLANLSTRIVTIWSGIGVKEFDRALVLLRELDAELNQLLARQAPKR